MASNDELQFDEFDEDVSDHKRQQIEKRARFNEKRVEWLLSYMHGEKPYFKDMNEHDFPDDVICWIWDEREQVPAGKCWAFKEFDAPAGATATIAVAVDDNGMLFVNGQLVTEFSGWDEPQVHDVTPFLKEGKNIVAIRGQDGGHLPCGILARIRLGETVIHTGGSWKTLPAGDEKTPPNLTGADTRKAFLVAPLGQGAWGKTAVLP